MPPRPPLSYQNLPDNMAMVTCECGWSNEPFIRGPFDPAEAIIAYRMDHMQCLEKPPKRYYAVAQEFYGKLKMLTDIETEGPPIGVDKLMELAKGFGNEHHPMLFVEIRIVSTWGGK